MDSQRGHDEPFDRQVIQTLREQADRHIDDPYGVVPLRLNWLWFSRMVITMEKSLDG